MVLQVVELLIRKLESEPSFHRKVDIFFLVDSITQCSHNQKGCFLLLNLDSINLALLTPTYIRGAKNAFIPYPQSSIMMVAIVMFFILFSFIQVSLELRMSRQCKRHYHAFSALLLQQELVLGKIAVSV